MIYPCLYKYLRDDENLILLVSNIFKNIKTLSDNVIFKDYDDDLFDELGLTYYYERYKRPLKVLYSILISKVDFTDSTKVGTFFSKIGKVAFARYGDNWLDIWNAYFLTDYKPLENYSMVQERKPDLKYKGKTSREQDTKIETSGTTSSVPFNETESTLVGETSGDSETTEQKASNYIESENSETGKEALTRSGNIGVTTSQQMLQSELDLRKLDFVKRVFEDVDSIILRDFYPCYEWIDC